MLNGNKQTSEKLLFKSVKYIQKLQKKKKFKDILKLSLTSVSPILQIKNIQRKRKKSIEFPFLLKSNLKISYGLKNLVKFGKKSSTNFFYYNFHNELINSCNKTGSGFNFKKQLHKEAFLKKKFANFRWF